MPTISFNGVTKRGKFYELILNGEKYLTTRYPRKQGQIEKGDVVKLYWKQRMPIEKKRLFGEPHLIGEAHIVHIYHVSSLLDAYLKVPDYVKGEGFSNQRELFNRWEVNKVTAAETGPLDVFEFKLKGKEVY